MATKEEMQSHINSVKEVVEKIDATDLDKVITALKSIDVIIPASYDDIGIGEAINTLSAIQRYRDNVITLKLKIDKKADSLNRFWVNIKNFILINDPEVSNFSTHQMKEAYCQNLMTELYNKMLEQNSIVDSMKSLLDNAIAKWNTCSRQIAVLEMQISLGEVERKKIKQ